MKERLDKINRELVRKQTERDIIKKDIKETEDYIESMKSKLSDIEEAQKLLQKTAKDLQNRLSIKINEFVTYTLEQVFGSGVYEFHMEFVEKRGKTEVEMYLTSSNDGRVDLKDPNNIRGGGGCLDIVALALRIAMWSLQPKRTNTFIYDQPFTNVSADVLPRVADLLQELSERMGLQFIIINHLVQFHNDEFKEITIRLEEGVSKVV